MDRTFGEWRGSLRRQVNMARGLGASEQTIKTAAYHVGNFLANRVDPENPEERVLRELWVAGNEDEQRTLAGLIARLVSSEDYPED